MLDLVSLANDPLLLALGLFAATFIAEDAATIAAGAIVGSISVDPQLPLIAVILGTALGDLSLYGAGRWGAGTSFGKKLRQRSDVSRALVAFGKRSLALLIIARFVPGMRLPVFTASGIVTAPFLQVAAVVGLSTPVWTVLLFEIARSAGSGAAEELVGAVLCLGLVLAALLIVPRALAQLIQRRT